MFEPPDRLKAALADRYALERKLGEGGMATVYLADDLKHGRKVALKVLKPELAAVLGAERFLAEIKTTANLQHPNILPLFDSGEADGFLYYVMPYIEGETLRDRIDRERQLPVDEALGIATAVAHALHTAHEAGVVHRDIKPGNILLSRGQPLVADFGIAIAVSAGGGGRLTETGLSLGTPYYMSPEQATGDQSIGPASDTFALACVLYEMLVGEPPYPGATAQAVLGKIIQGVPVSATAVRKTIPLNVDAAIRRALEKLPADRFTSAHAFARALADPGFRHGDAGPAEAAGPRSRTLRVWATGATTVALGLAVALAWISTRPEAPRPVERFADPLLAQDMTTRTGTSGYTLSPDGRMLVYRSNPGGGQILKVRRWEELAATDVRETPTAGDPTVSPDGRELAFTVGNEVRALAFDGGPVRPLAKGSEPEFGPDGYVYFTTPEGGTARVPSVGGAVDVVSTLGPEETEHEVTHVLPGGRWALLTVSSASGEEVQALDLRTGARTSLAFGIEGRYAPSGHLVFRSGTSLMAARFDPKSGRVLGTPVSVLDGVDAWTMADDGKLFYTLAAGGDEGRYVPSWLTAAGLEPVDEAWTVDPGNAPPPRPAVSPDGARVAIRHNGTDRFDIWVKELPAGAFSRVTADATLDDYPRWRPGTSEISYISERSGKKAIWSVRADGAGQSVMLVEPSLDVEALEWTPDGTTLLLQLRNREGNSDIAAFRPGADTVVTPLFDSPDNEGGPVVSPDGRWIAYHSNQTGRTQVYLHPYPDVTSGRRQVSVDGGHNPLWSGDGRSLYFVNGGAGGVQFMRVGIDDGGAPLGRPEALLTQSGLVASSATGWVYDRSPDDRFLVLARLGTVERATDSAGGPRVVLVNNFFEELRRIVPK